MSFNYFIWGKKKQSHNQVYKNTVVLLGRGDRENKIYFGTD